MSRRIVKAMVRKRFAVTLKGGEGAFAGVLLSNDADMFVFDDCRTLPKTPGETPQDIPGRVYVHRADIAYLQEVVV